MAKVIKLHKTAQDSLIEALEYILEEAKAGKLNSFIFAGKLENGDIATSYSGLDMGGKLELVGHVQVDIVNDMIKANYVTPGK